MGRHTVVVNLIGSDRQLSRTLRSASRQMKQFQLGVYQLGSVAKTAGLAIAGIGTAALAAQGSLILLAGAAGVAGAAIGGLTGAISIGLMGALGKFAMGADEFDVAVGNLVTSLEEMAQKTLPKLGKAMKGFFDPELYRPFFDAIAKSDEGFANIAKTVQKFIPQLSGSLGELVAVFGSDKALPFVENFLEGLDKMILGIKDFFEQFMANADPELFSVIAEDIAAALGWIGEKLGEVATTENWEKFKTKLREWWDALQPVRDAISAIWNFLINMKPETAVGLIAVGTAMWGIASAATLLNTTFSGLTNLLSPLLTTLFPGLTGSLTGLGAALAGAIWPILAVVAAIVALVAIFITAYQRSEALRNAVSTAWQEIQRAVSDAIDRVKPKLEELWKEFKKLWNLIADTVAPIFIALIQIFVSLGKIVLWAASIIAGWIIDFITDAIRLSQKVWGAVKAIIDFFVQLNNKVVGAIKGVINWFKEMWNSGDTMKERIRAAVASIGLKIQELKSNIATNIATIISKVKQLPGEFLAAGQRAGSQLWNAIKGWISRIDIIGWLKSKVPGPLKSLFNSLFTIDDLIPQVAVQSYIAPTRASRTSSRTSDWTTRMSAPRTTSTAAAPTYNITVNTMVADRNTGRRIVQAIQEYEYTAGTRWRA